MRSSILSFQNSLPHSPAGHIAKWHFAQIADFPHTSFIQIASKTGLDFSSDDYSLHNYYNPKQPLRHACRTKTS